MNEATFAAWYEWVCKGNRNPFGDPRDGGKAWAYWSYWDNEADKRPQDLTVLDVERMEDDPEANSVHHGALAAAEDWERENS